MTKQELKDGLENNNHTGFEEWFLEEGKKLDEKEGNELFKEYLEHMDKYGLRSEIIEWTVKNYIKGFDFETSTIHPICFWN
jgi:hypothetical protein